MRFAQAPVPISGTCVECFMDDENDDTNWQDEGNKLLRMITALCAEAKVILLELLRYAG